jgi:hypothetical protein
MSVGAAQSKHFVAKYWRAAWPILLALAMAALLFSTLFFNSPYCPAGTLMGGPHLGLGIAFGAFGAFLGMLALGVTHYFQKELPLTRPQQGSIVNTSWMAVLVWRWIGGVLLVLGLLGWGNGMLSYYCVSLRSISIHPSAFAETRTYSWTDVAEVKVGCRRGRSGTYGFFALHLTDERVVGLQGWKNYIAEIDRALAAVPFAYDDSKVAGCPSPYRELLAHRPGA